MTLCPPENFAMVWRGIYRSSYPTKRNFTFLQQLGLRSILFLCPEEYPESHTSFMQEHGVELLQFSTEGNKDLDEIPEETIRSALCAVLDPRNHPLLIHCNQGKHRTGCLVGCVRKVQRWSYVAIFDEYRRFAGSKARAVDQQFIERINLSSFSSVGGALDGGDSQRDFQKQQARGDPPAKASKPKKASAAGLPVPPPPPCDGPTSSSVPAAAVS